jgi:hypothetical protein
MRTLIFWIRSWFCNHKFNYSESNFTSENDFGRQVSIKISATCQNCGWHRSYWKY